MKARMAEFACEELEEAIELTEFAAGAGEQAGRIDIFRLFDRPDVELKASLVALDSAKHPHSVTKLEFTREKLDIVPDPTIDTSRWIDELQHEVGTASASARALLPSDREYPIHEAVLLEVRDGSVNVHSSSLSRMTDARLAAVLQWLSRYTPRSASVIRASFLTTDIAP